MQTPTTAASRLRRLGAIGFAFFLLKGIAWLVAGALVVDGLV